MSLSDNAVPRLKVDARCLNLILALRYFHQAQNLPIEVRSATARVLLSRSMAGPGSGLVCAD